MKRSNKFSLISLILLFIIYVPISLWAQCSIKMEFGLDTNYNPTYYSNYYIQRNYISESEFVEFHVPSENKKKKEKIYYDTFMISNNNWYNRFNGKYYLLFSVDSFVKKIETKNFYNFTFNEEEKKSMGVKDTVAYDVYTPIEMIERKGKKLYKYNVTEVQLRTTFDPYRIYFDPEIGVVRIEYPGEYFELIDYQKSESCKKYQK